MELCSIKGFILNIPNPSYGNRWSNILSLPLNLIVSKKHWVSIIKNKNKYYNLDSKLDMPDLIGEVSVFSLKNHHWKTNLFLKEPQLIVFLKQKIEESDCEIFVIVEKDVAEQQTWFRTWSKIQVPWISSRPFMY